MQITDFASLRAAFGTDAAAAKALGMSPQAFWSLKQGGRLPAHKYLTHKAILEQLGHSPVERLWSFEVPAEIAGSDA